MRVKFVVVAPEDQSGQFEVELPAIVGRGSEAKLQLPFALISRKHCELALEQGRVVVRDLESLNGIFVGGQRVESSPLRSGDLLTIGSVTLRAVFDDVLLARQPTGKTDLKNAGAVETVSLDDTAQASFKSLAPELGEPLGLGDDSRSDYFKPSDN
jgi:pSer/pThr/pTyr-binding forkhead associated (FHA) protein